MTRFTTRCSGEQIYAIRDSGINTPSIRSQNEVIDLVHSDDDYAVVDHLQSCLLQQAPIHHNQLVQCYTASEHSENI